MSLAAIQEDIFRAYDIRGIVGEGLNADVMYLLGQAIGSEALDKAERCLLLGSDARLSSPEFAEQMKNGILATGCDLIDLGQIPTPLLYFATHYLDSHSGVMITGSHNPKNYNGVKIVFRHQSLSDSQIARFKERILSNDLHDGKGSLQLYDIKPAYKQHILNDISLENEWNVILDCGNAITACVAPDLFSALNCQTKTLYCELDGSFPNHHPDPTDTTNLKDIIQQVQDDHADLGIAFDGDGDRVVLLSSSGRIIDADKLMMAFVKDILPENENATVVYDVKSSHHLHTLIESLNGKALMCKSGHSYVKKAMYEAEAILGGEYSAHIFFKHRWFGFDDGIYSAIRFLEIMDKNQLSADEIIDDLPGSATTPEIFIPVPEQEKFSLMKKLARSFNIDGATVNELDGLRISLDYGWGLIRASNTTPNLMLRFEADCEENLVKIKTLFNAEISRILPQLSITL